jgi:hypothetical protein
MALFKGWSIHALRFPPRATIRVGEIQVYSVHEQWEGKGRKFRRECVGGCVHYFVGVPVTNISSTSTSFKTSYVPFQTIGVHLSSEKARVVRRQS